MKSENLGITHVPCCCLVFGTCKRIISKMLTWKDKVRIQHSFDIYYLSELLNSHDSVTWMMFFFGALNFWTRVRFIKEFLIHFQIKLTSDYATVDWEEFYCRALHQNLLFLLWPVEMEFKRFFFFSLGCAIFTLNRFNWNLKQCFSLGYAAQDCSHFMKTWLVLTTLHFLFIGMSRVCLLLFLVS